MLKLTESEKAISESDWLDFEKELQLKLPAAMKEFYLKYNGGQPIPSCVHDKHYLFPMNAFLSIQEILYHIKQSRHEDDDSVFPEGFTAKDILPFAYDPGSGEYILSLRKEDFGKVYFYVLEQVAEIFGSWDSFEEFLDSFVEDNDEDE